MDQRRWLARRERGGRSTALNAEDQSSRKIAQFSDYWKPKIIAELNGQHVKLVKFRGEFVWHHHDTEDELFFGGVTVAYLIFPPARREQARGRCPPGPPPLQHRPRRKRRQRPPSRPPPHNQASRRGGGPGHRAKFKGFFFQHFSQEHGENPENLLGWVFSLFSLFHQRFFVFYRTNAADFPANSSTVDGKTPSTKVPSAPTTSASRMPVPSGSTSIAASLGSCMYITTRMRR